MFDSKEQEKIDEREWNWPLSQSPVLYSPAPLSASSNPFLFYIFYHYVCIELLYCRSIVCSEIVLTLRALLRRSFGVIFTPGSCSMGGNSLVEIEAADRSATVLFLVVFR